MDLFRTSTDLADFLIGAVDKGLSRIGAAIAPFGEGLVQLPANIIAALTNSETRSESAGMSVFGEAPPLTGGIATVSAAAQEQIRGLEDITGLQITGVRPLTEVTLTADMPGFSSLGGLPPQAVGPASELGDLQRTA